jgi:hypothetical protein
MTLLPYLPFTGTISHPGCSAWRFREGEISNLERGLQRRAKARPVDEYAEAADPQG